MERSRHAGLSTQMKSRVNTVKEKKDKLEGNFSKVISTGSTLLDLAISSGRIRGGGLPGGIFVEIYGPESSGKTAIICEIGGNIQKKGGTCHYYDPEGSTAGFFGVLHFTHLKTKVWLSIYPYYCSCNSLEVKI